jgi:hypothetical protein
MSGMATKATARVCPNVQLPSWEESASRGRLAQIVSSVVTMKYTCTRRVKTMKLPRLIFFFCDRGKKNESDDKNGEKFQGAYENNVKEGYDANDVQHDEPEL